MASETPERLVRRIGRRIVELRQKRGLTQAELAERLRVSVQWMSRVEVGENLTVYTLARLARALGVRAINLFEEPAPEVREIKRGRPRKTK